MSASASRPITSAPPAESTTSSVPDTVRLVSADGFDFIVDRKCAMVSGTIKNILSHPGKFTENLQNEIIFRDIKGVILEKVCQYFYYKVRYTNATTDMPEFPIEPELSVELLLASDFLDV